MGEATHRLSRGERHQVAVAHGGEWDRQCSTGSYRGGPSLRARGEKKGDLLVIAKENDNIAA